MEELEITVTTSDPFQYGRRDLTFRLDIPGVTRITILKQKVCTESELFRNMWQCLIDGVDYEGPLIHKALEGIELIDHDTVRLNGEVSVARKLLGPPLAEALGLRAPGDNVKG